MFPLAASSYCFLDSDLSALGDAKLVINFSFGSWIQARFAIATNRGMTQNLGQSYKHGFFPVMLPRLLEFCGVLLLYSGYLSGAFHAFEG